ncbi:bifunctional riboflavin kinase/FAD synthetase [Amorphus sp. 3PC139-8]|uniref:bifunctional riboflavin kinase/FAD synthetase n=1 Tax=Amorphus sp. 3PC139-8 TaxID=2735676 RepID=UPI00345DABB1
MTSPRPDRPDAPFAAAIDAVPERLRGGIAAIGNFDGVHRGHQEVLGVASRMAREAGRPALVLTFEPHPRSYFRPDQPVFRLTPPPERSVVLKALGLDGMVVVPFNAELAATEADVFVDQILRDRLNVAGAVVGYNFHFGKRRAGTPDFLRERGAADGFEVEVVSPGVDAHGEPISSTRVRTALEAGSPDIAAELLGYRWLVVGTVVHGDKRGRVLGYPTANLRLDPACGLRHGVYAVRARVDGRLYDGVASFGRRPMFDDGAPLFETHLFDFSGDLYDKETRISVFAFLRPELKFDSVDALVAQMDADSAQAKALLATATPLSDLDTRLSFEQAAADATFPS